MPKGEEKHHRLVCTIDVNGITIGVDEALCVVIEVGNERVTVTDVERMRHALSISASLARGMELELDRMRKET